MFIGGGHDKLEDPEMEGAWSNGRGGALKRQRVRWCKGRWEELGGSRSHGVFYPIRSTNFLMRNDV